MHYYKFNIGDYASHTQHLDEIEDLAYRRMLDWCYLHESPLPDDPKQVSRLIRMRSHSESIAVVLQEFFLLGDFGWYQPKVMREIDQYKDKSKKAKASAEARWAKKPIKSDANALQTESECNANHKPRTINQEPLTKNHNTKQKPKVICPHREILNLWDKKMPSYIARPQDKNWNSKRAAYKHLQARWGEVVKEQGEDKSLEWFERLFEYIAKQNSFLTNPESKWFKLDWVVKSENFIKITEGSYQDG